MLKTGKYEPTFKGTMTGRKNVNKKGETSMDNFRRLTIDRVKRAYRKTGLIPAQNVFGKWNYTGTQITQCGCGITAVCLHEYEKAIFDQFTEGIDIDDIQALYLEDIPVNYLEGFVIGFDGDHDKYLSMSPLWNLGKEDGINARNAIFIENGEVKPWTDN